MASSTNTIHPFIIWTLQRTGGTNLAQRLTERSGLPGTQHEPFNPGRIFGHITEQWLKDKNPEMLEQAVEAICQRGVIIKHCVETVSWEVTEALVRASVKAGYRHLFLYRKNAVDRLLSLHFAQKTGVWGPDMLNSGAKEVAATSMPNAADSDAFTETVPVEKLVTHEKICVQFLTKAWQFSKSLGALPLAIAYEDIYRTSDPGQPARILLPLLQYLGLSENDAADRAWVSEVVGKGDQGTRDKYRDFPGVAELAKRIKTIAPFLPVGGVASITAQIVAEHHPWIERCFIDVLPNRVAVGETFDLGGVVVLSKEAPDSLALKLEGSSGVVDIEWGMPSQRMAVEYPQGSNSAKARFRLLRHYFHENEESLVLTVSGPNAERVVVAEVFRSIPPDYSRICIEPEDRLIIDVGANDGADSWYYLHKGYRVVAVEAIPELADNLRQTFNVQITAKRLFVDQIAIAEERGEVAFTINDDRTEWSSAHGASKASAGSSRTITVQADTLASVIERHGAPYYIKIDIEGGEQAAVSSLCRLPAEKLPAFLSFEVNPSFGDVLERLFGLGYSQFQLIRQGPKYLPALPVPSLEGLDYRCSFSSNMSGPFGKDLPRDQWVGLVEVIKRILHSMAENQERKNRGENPAWFDVHATRFSDL